MNIYRPVPTRAWARVQLDCSYTPAINTGLSKQMLEKGNVLQYKKNSANLTKSQKYALIARGKWTNRTKTYASQSDICSNPNTNSLAREGGTSVCIDRSTPFQYNVLNPFECTEIVCDYNEQSDTVYTAIVDGGVLLGNQTVNPCTQALEKTTYLNPCNLTTASDVPGKVQALCWDLRLEPWYTRERYIMNTSGNKWPVNYKNFNVAYVPKLSVSVNLTEVSLSWTYCYLALHYQVFQNDVLLGNTTSLSIPPFSLLAGTYNFYVIAVVANASSGPSNVVTATII